MKITVPLVCCLGWHKRASRGVPEIASNLRRTLSRRNCGTGMERIDASMFPISASRRDDFDMTDANWNRVATIHDVSASGGLLGRIVEEIPIAIYHVDGAYYATSDLCTHGWARLSEGYLEGFEIECPLHQGRFDVRTGLVQARPCRKAIRTVPVHLDGEDLLINPADLGPLKEDAALRASKGLA